MKRIFLVQHLIRNGCELEGEEPTHSNWINPENDQRAEVPRQTEIETTVAETIYSTLGIGNPVDDITTIH